MTLAITHPTLMDFVRAQDPQGKIAPVVELLSETNDILPDMVWKEGNLPTGEKTTVRTGIPEATWRKLNYGVQPTKSQTRPIVDVCGMLEAYAEVDKKLADLNGNTAAWRASEDRAHLEGMNIQMARALFYEDVTANSERITGLAPRFSDTTAESGANIIDGGGEGSTNTSIWLVAWDLSTVHGIFPKGSMAGFNRQELGEVTLLDAAGGRYQGYRTHYQWDCGLTVRDWRYIVRIANIDTAALTKDAASGADIIDLMTQAAELLHSENLGRPVFYCNRTIRSILRRQLTNKSNIWLNMQEAGGKKVMHFGEFPVRRVDQLVNTEEAVS